jgi:hypothetical protein
MGPCPRARACRRGEPPFRATRSGLFIGMVHNDVPLRPVQPSPVSEPTGRVTLAGAPTSLAGAGSQPAIPVAQGTSAPLPVARSRRLSLLWPSWLWPSWLWRSLRWPGPTMDQWPGRSHAVIAGRRTPRLPRSGPAPMSDQLPDLPNQGRSGPPPKRTPPADPIALQQTRLPGLGPGRFGPPGQPSPPSSWPGLLSSAGAC